MKKVILFTLSCLVTCLFASAQKVGLSIHYNMVMQIPKEVYSMSDLSKRQMIINQLSNQHKTYTLFTNGNECAFSTTVFYERFHYKITIHVFFQNFHSNFALGIVAPAEQFRNEVKE